jgi:hypothetical protein
MYYNGKKESMINPEKISNFNLTEPELEENILFWVCAAGKNGVTSANCLNRLLTQLAEGYSDYIPTPFKLIRSVIYCDKLAIKMKECGIGCYTNKSNTFWSLAHSGLDLRKCSVDELMKIKGIGAKTARGFILHTRPNQRYAVIDTHILKFLRSQGIITPKSTPGKYSKKYKELEKEFLDICDRINISPATLDLHIWNYYSLNPKTEIPYL